MSSEHDFEKLEHPGEVSSTSRTDTGDKKGASKDKCSSSSGFGFPGSVRELVYWRDIKKSAAVFVSGFLLLLSFSLFSLVSIVSYLSLAALSISISFVVYKKVLQAVQKTPEGHPFREYLEKDLNPPKEKIHKVVDVATEHVTCTLRELRRLFLIEDLVDTLKMALLLWVLTYIGDWFNGLTIVILAFVGAFSIPKFYETFQAPIDQYAGIAKVKFAETYKLLKDKVPAFKKAEKVPEKKD